MHRVFLAVLPAFLACLAWAPMAMGQVASALSPHELKARFIQLSPALQDSPFHRPLFVESQEASGRLRGDVYAVMNFPFANVQKALKDPANWCDVMILHPNTKQCQVPRGNDSVLRLSVGKKGEQPAEDAFHLDMNYALVSSTPEYFQVLLTAQDGPLGTSDYRIVVQAMAIGSGQSFLHLSYSYRESWAGQMATKAYLATAGRSKVGFSTTGRDADGRPLYVGGLRGAVERNAMRYYLAIDAYLQAPGKQFDKRLSAFFAATEQYARQLHEQDRDTYIAIKQREYQRQQNVAYQ